MGGLRDLEKKIERKIKKNEVIAVDLGGTNLRVARVRNNKILQYVKRRTPKQRNKLIMALYDTIASLMTLNVKAIGVSSAGPLEAGIIKNPPNMPLHNFNMKEKLKKVFNKRVEVENDANCVAIAEAKLGCKKKNFVVLTLGTGIGGGVIINGDLYIGEGYASEPGHIILDRGMSFEQLWQENRRFCKKCFGRMVLFKDLVKRKDRKAKKVLQQASVILGKGIGSLIDVFDPEVIILAGGVREAGGKFLDLIKEQAKKYTLIPRTTKIEWSKLEHPGTLGASLLVS